MKSFKAKFNERRWERIYILVILISLNISRSLQETGRGISLNWTLVISDPPNGSASRTGFHKELAALTIWGRDYCGDTLSSTKILSCIHKCKKDFTVQKRTLTLSLSRDDAYISGL